MSLFPWLALWLGATVLLCGLCPSPARAEGPKLEARSWVLIDAADGAVLAGSSSDLRLPMASTTKLMTAYLAIRRLPLDRRVRVPAYPADPIESLMGLQEGQRVSVRDLLYGLILLSGNDAAVALATAVSGNTGSFVRLMNRTADRLGLRDTRFTNPIGLDSPEHYSSASDLAMLARILLRIRAFRKIAAAREAELTSYRPPRRILTRNDFLLQKPWATGVKTGRTLGAGYVLVSSAARSGVSLIGTVTGAPTEGARDAETIRLMEYGFGLFRERRFASRGQVVASVPLRFEEGDLDLLASREAVLKLRTDQKVRTELRAVPAEAEGPIARGEQLGRLLVLVDGRRRESIALRAARPVAEPSLVDRLKDPFGGPGIYLASAALALVLGAALVIRIRSGRVRRSLRRISRSAR